MFNHNSSISFSGHRLEFIIGDHVLPYDMTVYQAVQQFGSAPMFEPAEADPENRNSAGSGASGAAVMYGSPGIWARIHTIYYRPVTSATTNSNTDAAAGSHSCAQGNIKCVLYIDRFFFRNSGKSCSIFISIVGPFGWKPCYHIS